jgi:hypothetical protein
MVFCKLLLFALQISTCPPQDGYKLVRELNITGQQHYSDALGNIYIINGSEISRYDRDYRNIARYANAYLGQPASLDVSDPLRILTFYKDYNTLLWLDNFLTELRSPVRLDELGYEQVELVCSSSQGGFWIYNSLTDQIHSFDAGMNLVHESISLRPMLGRSEGPVFIVEKNRNIYLGFPGTGILVFDRFGNYRKTLPVTGISRFQVTDSYLFYMREEAFFRFSLTEGTETEITLPAEQVPLHAEIQDRVLYLYYTSKVSVYQ